MVAEINIQSDERMLIDTRNAVFILPRCRSRCSRVTCRHRGGGLGSSSSPGATVLSRVWSDYRSMRLFMTCNCRSTVQCIFLPCTKSHPQLLFENDPLYTWTVWASLRIPEDLKEHKIQCPVFQTFNVSDGRRNVI